MKSRGAFRRRRVDAGFTLAEMLVATMLLSIVMTAVYSLFHTSISTWRMVEKGYDLQLEARSFFNIFAHEYGNVFGQAGYLCEGKEDTITLFVITQPENLEEGESRRLMKVEYSYNRSKREIRREEAFVEAALPKMPPKKEDHIDVGRIKYGKKFKETVANNVVDFKIRYIWTPLPEKRDDKVPPEPIDPLYFDQHQQKWGLPDAVELTVAIAADKKEEEPYTITSTFITRAPHQRRTQKMLDEMVGGNT